MIGELWGPEAALQALTEEDRALVMNARRNATRNGTDERRKGADRGGQRRGHHKIDPDEFK